MPYCSASDVAALTQNILSACDNYSESTCPTLTEVNAWMSSGCSIIEARLSSAGYSVPVASTTVAYNWLRDLNTYYAVSLAELSRANYIIGPGERARFQVFDKMFWDGIDRLLQMDLTSLGIGQSSTGTIYVGGITESNKDVYRQDTGYVQPRFRRGQFAFPGTVRPDSVVEDDET